jgi:hypothetical protein
MFSGIQEIIGHAAMYFTMGKGVLELFSSGKKKSTKKRKASIETEPQRLEAGSAQEKLADLTVNFIMSDNPFAEHVRAQLFEEFKKQA